MDSEYLYIGLCLTLPVLWGIVSARLFDWWQAYCSRRAAPRDLESEMVDMYHI